MTPRPLRLLPPVEAVRGDVERLARGVRAGRWDAVAHRARRLRPVLPFAVRPLAEELASAAQSRDALRAVQALVLLAGEIDRLAHLARRAA